MARNMGYHADTCREICCSRLKFHKGILKVETMMLMRILMNRRAQCVHMCVHRAYTSWGRSSLRMASLLYGSRSRAEWSLTPTAIVSLV